MGLGRVEGGEQSVQFRADARDFGQMDGREGGEPGFACAGQQHADPAPVNLVILTGDEVGTGQTINQLHRTIMLNNQEGSEVRDGCGTGGLQGFDAEQSLMLAGGQARDAG